MEKKSQTRSLYTEHPVALRYLMNETLFAVDGQAVSEPLSKVPGLSFFGGNRSGILFISPHSSGPGEHTLPESEMRAFEKILGALQLTTENIALIHVPNSSSADAKPSLRQLVDFFKSQRIVLLGTDLQIEGVKPVLHEIQQEGDYRYLHSYSFREMGEDVQKKRLFWNQVKALFAS